jgi:hypothetical protein
VQIAKDEYVHARRRREACRGTLTGDNAAGTDSDKQDAQVIFRKFLGHWRIPRRPRGAMTLSQKTCLRSAYRFFGLKKDMFLTLRGCGGPPWAAYAMRRVRGMYRLLSIHPAFCTGFPEDILFFG